MTRALLIGGRGFFGRHVATALRAMKVDVTIGSRRVRDGVSVDVERIEPSLLAGYDVVINCADTLATPPDHLHEAAMTAGVLYIEPTAEPGPIARALARRDKLSGNGVTVLGLGIFPGLSNLAAHAVFKENGRQGPIEVGMQFSPFSAAGAGMVALIAHLMAEPAPYYADGIRKLAPAFSRGRPMPYEQHWCNSLRAAIPETDLLRATLGTADVLAVLSPRPAIMMPLLRIAATLTPPWRWWKRAYLAVIRGSVGLLRRVLFRKRPTKVIISALAGRHGTAREGRYLNLTTADGIACGAYVIAAAISLIQEHRPKPGTYVVDELLTLDDLLAAMAKIPNAPEVRSTRVPASQDPPPTA